MKDENLKSKPKWMILHWLSRLIICPKLINRMRGRGDRCFVGYFHIWLFVTGVTHRLVVQLMCSFMFIAAHARGFFNTANVVTAVQNFSNYGCTIVGIKKGNHFGAASGYSGSGSIPGCSNFVCARLVQW